MVDPDNQIQVVDFTRMLLQELKRIEANLPMEFDEYYDSSIATDEEGVNKELCRDIFGYLDDIDGPVEFYEDDGLVINLTEGKVSTTISFLEDQGINPANPP